MLRFFNLRYPHDYNKLPGVWYWVLHLVWIFPWSLFLPAAVAVAWKTRHNWMKHLRQDAGQTVDFYLDNALRQDVATQVQRLKFRVRTIWLLSLFSAWTLLFFSISTNQEYYTFPGLAAAGDAHRRRCWLRSRLAAPLQAQPATAERPSGSPAHRRCLP